MNSRGRLALFASSCRSRVIAQFICLCKTGQQARVRHLSLNDLLPPTEDYMTYEGSMTLPGCHETITWIVMNKPIYITLDQASLLVRYVR